MLEVKIEKFLELCDNDIDFAEELRQYFYDNILEFKDVINEDEKDCEKLKTASHKLKSNCLQLNLYREAQIFKEIESLCSEENINETELYLKISESNSLLGLD